MQTMADDPQVEDDKPVSKVAIIDENYCTQKSQEFIVLKKMTKFQTNAVFQVFDVDQNLLLQADGLKWLLHRTFLMKDSHDSPIVTLHEARITDKRRWDVYEGDSTDAPDHMFKVQRTSAFQVNARLDILFLDNPNPEEGRFQIKKDDASSNTAAMYQGSRIIARVSRPD
uniref:Uncharacterized protein n=1 Tax=Chenopodium quinoa TaxID=63459 RepID=A0A803M429_CHEQI